jgi:hypothetical protein
MDMESGFVSEYQEETVGSVWERIEDNFEISEALLRKGAVGAARRYLRAAWLEYVQVTDVLRVYLGSEQLAERLVSALVRIGEPELFAELESQAECALQPEESMPALAA